VEIMADSTASLMKIEKFSSAVPHGSSAYCLNMSLYTHLKCRIFSGYAGLCDFVQSYRRLIIQDLVK
jgi:hypothetical protein